MWSSDFAHLVRVSGVDLTVNDEYVDKAVQMARDLERLALLRPTLRERLRTSSLCDGRGFTRRLEQAYREMWRRYVGSHAGS